MTHLSLLASFILAACFPVTTVAFLPRVLSGNGKSRTRDHAMITKEGFLKPLLYFFVENPQYLKNDSLTDVLDHLLSIDGQEAIQVTIDNISPQIKFLNALNEIQSANAEIDSFPFSTSASAHFDGEQFEQGATRLVQLRQELVTMLLQGDKLQHARNLAGEALHTLQDFYSHSNWIELGNPVPYDILGRPGSDIPKENIASPNEATCKDCKPGECENNLITMKLTSGYRSDQDIKKPENMGKCSHGGTMDESRLKPATGGINKDSTSTLDSPHASLHKIAADLAIEATSIFLSDIRSTVGDDIFAKFLNLKSENSMALVIDVSGSMSDEISEVKRVSIDFVQRTLQKKGASFTYILVPFSDPEVGPVTVTSDANTVIDAVNNLTASGGGDCPELGMTGVYQALLHCPPETIIYYFSDADVKDEHREREIMSLAKEKKVKINLILSGECGRRRKRDAQQSDQLLNFIESGRHRTRRNAQSQALYQAIAAQTGGQVLETTKARVAQVVEVIDSGGSSNSSVTLRKVELLNMKETRTQSFSGQVHFVDVDSTLERLVFILTAANSPSVDVKTEEGNSLLLKTVTQSDKLLITEASNLISGTLKLAVSCVGPYTLQVTGSSPLDFTYQLLDVEDLERGTTRRVVGNPLRGQTLLLTVDFIGKEIEKASNLTLVGVDGTDLQTFNMTQGSYKNSYFVTFVPSPEKFRLKVTGTDKTGARFQRVKPTLFTLGDVKLSQNVDGRNSSNTIIPGKTLEVEINVKNSGDTQTLYFTASDDLEYYKGISPSKGTLGMNDTLVLRLTLLAPSNAKYGVTSIVTVFASQNSDFTQVVNFMVLFVTVASKNPDLDPPSCTVVNKTGTCAKVYGRPDCILNAWKAKVMFIDAGEGLSSITTRGNKNGTLEVGRFNQGVVNKSIVATYTSNCCHPGVLFVGLDLVGNMGTCSISLVPDIVSMRAKPSTTTLSLSPGNTTKVPFKLVNLGSKGSFSFEVTKTPALISYVMPFSLVLKANASTTGQVVIKSRGEVRKPQNLTVKAVIQPGTVHERKIALFSIQVALSTNKNPDLSPPSCTVINQTRSCNNTHDGSKCMLSTWHARVVFIDTGEGLASIATQGNDNGTLRVDAFNLGAVNTSITASFTSNCCHPGVLFVGLDLVGNMGTCSISLVPDIVSMRAKPSTTTLSLSPGNTTKVPFKLVNLGSKGSFSFEVTKTPALISYVMPFSLVLKANASTTGQVVIKSRGEVRKPQNLTVKAVIQPGTVHERKIALFSIQVALSTNKNPDLSPPSCTVINQTRSCNNTHDRSKCMLSTWHARVVFIDTGEGLASIATQGNDNGTLGVDAFNLGAVNTSITASFTSNCCHPRVLFVGLDLVGNMGTCSISLVPDIVSLRAKPRTTAVSLYPGNTTKIPFTLLNLGSNGSFLFEVTKTPALISYVMPLSLILPTNASAVCHVVIKPRGEVREVLNLTVNAVSQLSNVNLRRVALFSIQVSVVPAFPHLPLEAAVTKDRFSLTDGGRLEVNFTVQNLALDDTFTFHVLTNQSSLDGNVEPSHVFLKTMQSTSCLLILTSQSDASTKPVTQVNVTATLASRSTGVREFQVFSIIVKVDDSSHKTEDSYSGNRSLKTLYVVLIATAVFILLITLISALVYCQKRGSLRPKSSPKVDMFWESSGSQLQLHNKSEDVTVEDLDDLS